MLALGNNEVLWIRFTPGLYQLNSTDKVPVETGVILVSSSNKLCEVDLPQSIIIIRLKGRNVFLQV